MFRRVAAIFVTAALLSGCARPLPYARTPPTLQAVDSLSRWENVLLLPPGTRIQVTLRDHAVVNGRLAESRTDLVILDDVVGVSPGPRGEAILTRPEIAKVERRTRDGLRNGTALGALIGAGVGFVVAVGWLGLTPDDEVTTSIRFWHLESFSAVGAGVGALAGSLADASRRREGTVLVYVAPRTP